MVKEANDSSSSSSSCSGSDSESFTDEQSSSFDTDPAEQISSKPKNTRYIMADDRLQESTKRHVTYMSGSQKPYNQHMTRENVAVPAMASGSYFIENNYINRAFSYYNQQHQQMSQRLVAPQLQQQQQQRQFVQPQYSFQQYPMPYRQNVEFAAFAAVQQQRQSEFASYSK